MRYRLKKNDVDGRNRICEAVLQLNGNREWSIEIKQWREKRSNAQVSYFWAGIVNPVVEETGNDKNTIHDWLCGEYFGWEEHKVFGQVRKRPVQTLTSPEPLSVTQMVNFNEWCVSRLAQEGYLIESPREIDA